MIKKKLSDKEYNEAEGLRSTDIKRILVNPYLYKLGLGKKSSSSLNNGSYAHALLLDENSLAGFEIYEGGRGVTAKIKEIEEKGLIAVLDKDALEIQNAIQSLKKSEAYGLFANCEYEISCFQDYLIPEINKNITLKCKVDALGKDYILDLKTTSIPNGASYNEFSKSCANYGYYIQAAHYMRITGIKKFLFVVVELVEPYMVGLYSLDTAAIDFGFDEVERAIKIFASLGDYKSNIYVDVNDLSKVQTISLPNWVYYKK